MTRGDAGVRHRTIDPDLWQWLVRRLYYLPGDLQDPEYLSATARQLLTQIDDEHGTPGNYFYLSRHRARVLRRRSSSSSARPA